MPRGTCRFCLAPLEHSFVDLGMSPLSNAYLHVDQLAAMEPFYPLHAYVCGECLLVQLEEFETPEKIFSDYAYFSSYSETWLKHAQAYADYMIGRFELESASRVIEIASNDGYLLRFFKDKGIGVLGIEPAKNVAQAALKIGIPTLIKFFGSQTARDLVSEGEHADLLVGNNVLAHVPDVNAFVEGMRLLLKPTGVITVEFAHVLRLIKETQFDTIYHEHFSYFSLMTAQKILAAHDLVLFDVEELPTHGGSLRVFARHAQDDSKPVSGRVANLVAEEKKAGLDDLSTYADFSEKVKQTKRRLLEFLIELKREGTSIVGYGAPAKGNTLLNYCGIRTDFIDYTVDRNPHKQGRYLPGTHIPIFHPDKVKETKPDYLFILPWNLRGEIVEQMSLIRKWGGKFVIPIPEPTVLP